MDITGINILACQLLSFHKVHRILFNFILRFHGVLLAVHEFDEVAFGFTIQDWVGSVRDILTTRSLSAIVVARRILAEGVGGVFEEINLILNEFLNLLLLIFHPYLILCFRLKVVKMLPLG